MYTKWYPVSEKQTAVSRYNKGCFCRLTKWWLLANIHVLSRSVNCAVIQRKFSSLVINKHNLSLNDDNMYVCTLMLQPLKNSEQSGSNKPFKSMKKNLKKNIEFRQWLSTLIFNTVCIIRLSVPIFLVNTKEEINQSLSADQCDLLHTFRVEPSNLD